MDVSKFKCGQVAYFIREADWLEVTISGIYICNWTKKYLYEISLVSSMTYFNRISEDYLFETADELLVYFNKVILGLLPYTDIKIIELRLKYEKQIKKLEKEIAADCDR